MRQKVNCNMLTNHKMPRINKMWENGQITKIWKDWSWVFSTHDCTGSEATDPMKLPEVVLAFTVLLGGMVLVLTLVLAEIFVKTATGTRLSCIK